ncbi:uncharacterized protein LOC113497929 [Trichoplusia ni]|uniref:Uncharacterized protein LOC113497929 n=1 Tax=Trichoplusia ni TaxID=7111 RepID=A0A7E5VYZ3_TRINI|nr:uncharacterized protein LOC113497929 [Trichoplusia ni]
MSLTKLLKAPIKLFRKEVITFLVIRRYDLSVFEDRLRYIAVKPSASMSVLRQKVWHILDLPDYCEEIIVLKSNSDTVVPLAELRHGNDPHHPFILEVWLPGKRKPSSTFIHNKLLTIGNGEDRIPSCNTGSSTNTICDGNLEAEGDIYGNCFSQSTLSNETLAMNKLHVSQHQKPATTFITDFRKWDNKLSGKKSRENFADILIRIQNDLNMLGNKLDSLLMKVEKTYS